MYNNIIVKSDNNETIYQFLKRSGFSENYVKNLRKKEGYILLNNKVAFTNDYVKTGDVLQVYKNPNSKESIFSNITPLNIVYEDDDLLIVNKPSGMPTIPSRRHLKYNLAGAVLNYMKEKESNFVVRIINRLDKETFGLVCVAKHSYISNLLNSNDYIEKTYYAICVGKIEKCVIDKNIATTCNSYGYNNQKREISTNGKPAITYVNPLIFDGKNTLCEITLKHGRTHQIRVHMASINHALLGDALYGEKSDAINHTALCCGKMKVFNPIANKHIEVKIDLPEDFKKAFNSVINIV